MIWILLAVLIWIMLALLCILFIADGTRDPVPEFRDDFPICRGPLTYEAAKQIAKARRENEWNKHFKPFDQETD